ncbi:metallophosphoesterase family protein [Pontibacillus marinus]|uniref:Phosphoesterase n=1 Tax=Pontibacillus marinus BH030004 = DSM 16465 TaxID=1385511 RepID=A0A0A5G3Z3_9BACI|nr:metallophosphoesterase [Pontibacillus marinus]KGX85810.1 phosphodiesterase [Pontibacillus marinus BH030004 = DSM 16465]
MKIVVLSDTHMPKKGSGLPRQVLADLEDTDAIIHAGDWSSIDLHNELSKYAEVYGVYGNVDGEEITEIMKDKIILEFQGYRIGVVHGHGEKKTTEKRVIEAFHEEEVDLIIFGHSHLPLTRWYNKTLMFNPGSLTDKRKLPYYSYGIITLGDAIHCNHVYIREKS